MSELDKLLGLEDVTSGSPSGLGWNDIPTSSFRAGLHSGWSGLQESGGHIAQALGGINLADFIARKQAEQDFYSRNAPGATTWSGLGGVMDGGKVSDWLAFNAGQSLPSMAPVLVGGLGGGLLRGAAMGAARTFGKDAIATGAERLLAGQAEGAITGAMERAALEQATKQVATRYAATAGAALGDAPVALGDILGNQYEAGKRYDVPSALAGTVPYVAFDMLLGGEAKALKAATGGLERAGADTVGRGFLKSTLAGENRLGGIIRGIPRTAIEEGIGETGQEVINQSLGRMAVDPNATLTSRDAPTRYLESFMAGAGVGGLMGGPAHVFAKPKLATTEDVAARVGDLKTSLNDIFAGNKTALEIKDAQTAETERVAKEQEKAAETRQNAMSALETNRPEPLPRLPYDAIVGSAVAPVINPLGAAPLVFSDGTVVLTGNQELTKRYPGFFAAPQAVAEVGPATNVPTTLDEAQRFLQGRDLFGAPIVESPAPVAVDEPIQAKLDRATLNLFGPNGGVSPLAAVPLENQAVPKTPTFATMHEAFVNAWPTIEQQAIEHGHMTEETITPFREAIQAAQTPKQFEAAKAKFEEALNVSSSNDVLPANPAPADAGVLDAGRSVDSGSAVGSEPRNAQRVAAPTVLASTAGNTVAGNGDAIGFQVSQPQEKVNEKAVQTNANANEGQAANANERQGQEALLESFRKGISDTAPKLSEYLGTPTMQRIWNSFVTQGTALELGSDKATNSEVVQKTPGGTTFSQVTANREPVPETIPKPVADETAKTIAGLWEYAKSQGWDAASGEDYGSQRMKKMGAELGVNFEKLAQYDPGAPSWLKYNPDEMQTPQYQLTSLLSAVADTQAQSDLTKARWSVERAVNPKSQETPNANQSSEPAIPANQPTLKEQTSESQAEKTISETARRVQTKQELARWNQALGNQDVAATHVGDFGDETKAVVPTEIASVKDAIQQVLTLDAAVPADREALKTNLLYLAGVAADDKSTFGSSPYLKNIPSVVDDFLIERSDLSIGTPLERMINRARERAATGRAYVTNRDTAIEKTAAAQSADINRVAKAVDKGASVATEFDPLTPFEYDTKAAKELAIKDTAISELASKFEAAPEGDTKTQLLADLTSAREQRNEFARTEQRRIESERAATATPTTTVDALEPDMSKEKATQREAVLDRQARRLEMGLFGVRPEGSQLTLKHVKQLAAHYGIDFSNDETFAADKKTFATKFRKDVSNFLLKGPESVPVEIHGAIVAAIKDQQGDIRFSTNTTVKTQPAGMTKSVVEKVVENYRRGWKALPQTTVLSLADMSPAQREIYKDRKGGFFTDADGVPHVVLVAENLDSAGDAVATLYHEALGHFGLQQKFDTKKTAVMNAIYNTNDQVRRSATTELAANPQNHVGEDKYASATEEVLSQMSEKGTLPQSALNRLIAFVRSIARDMGMQVKFSNNDVIAVLRQAHDAARTVGMSAFDKWFGNSKVVDAEGNPLVVYHGATTAINTFDTTYGGYFTKDPTLAAVYTHNLTGKQSGTEPNILPVYLSLQNPKIIKSPGFWKMLQNGFDATKARPNEADHAMYLTPAKIAEYKAQGFDGIVNEPWNELIVFDPTQVKSATGNNSNFDGTNPDIRFRTVAQASPTSIPEHLVDMASHYGGKTGLQAASDATHYAGKIVDMMMFLPDAVRRYKDRMPSMKLWYDALLAKEERKNELKAPVEAIAMQINKLSVDELNATDQFLGDSTFQQKWAYDPQFTREVGGKTVPYKVTVDPEFAARFNALRPKVQAVVKDIFALGDANRQTLIKDLKDLGISDVFLSKTQLTGPYASLKRRGNHAAVLKSDKLVAAEKAAEGTPPTSKEHKLVDELKSDENHYVMLRRETPGQAAVAFRDLMATNKYSKEGSYLFPFKHGLDTQFTMPDDALRKVLAAVKADESVDADVKAVMEGNIKAMYARTTEDRVARQAMQQRKYRPGYDPNMIRGVMEQGEADANFLSMLEHGSKINDAIRQVQKDGDANNSEHKAIADFAIAHHIETSKAKNSPIVDRLVAATSTMQLTMSLAYHLSNMTQVTQVTLPKLAAKFNDYSGAWRHIWDGYKFYRDVTRGSILTGKELDLSKVKDEGLRDVLLHASKRLLLDVGMDGDIKQYTRFQNGYALVDNTSALVSKIVHKFRQISRGVELMNRVATAAATYNMHKEKMGTSPEALANAKEYAIEMLETTQGDMSGLAAPLAIKKLPKYVVQYRKFQLMMAALYVDGFNQAFRGETPEVRAIGRRFLAYKLFHTGMAAGVLGMPLMNLVGPAFAFLFGDKDEPKDFERMMREKIGNQTLADMLLHGPLSLMGLDTSAKLGDNNVFSIMPYTDIDVTSKKGLALTAAGLAGGPAFGQASHMADGIGMMTQGEYYKGIEKLLPRGLEYSMQGFRMANDGFTLKNGDVMVRPEDISGVALALQTLGLPPTEIKRYQWFQSQQIEIKQFYADHERALKKSYLDAKESGDSTVQQTAKDDWRQLQEGKVKARIYFNNAPEELKKRDMSALTDYPIYQTKREKKLQKSIPVAGR